MLSVFSPVAAPTLGSFGDSVLLPSTLVQQVNKASRIQPFHFSSKRGMGGWQSFKFSAKALVLDASIQRQTTCMLFCASSVPTYIEKLLVPLMEENFSMLYSLIILFFHVGRCVLELFWSPHDGLKVPFIFPLLGALGRVMRTLAAGMCGKFQICFRGKNWHIIFFDGYIERKALRETDS